MIHSRGPNGSAAGIIWTLILWNIASEADSHEASVLHVNMAPATVILLRWSEIGSAVRSAVDVWCSRLRCRLRRRVLSWLTCAVAGAFWTSEMPVKLAEYLPGFDQATRDALFGIGFTTAFAAVT